MIEKKLRIGVNPQQEKKKKRIKFHSKNEEVNTNCEE